MIEIRVRPMLVSGMLASTGMRPVILIDSEQPRAQQTLALWHEAMHLLGIRDDAVAEDLARRLAAAVPEILDLVPIASPKEKAA